MDYRTLRKLAIVFGLVIHAQAEEFLVGTTLKLPCNVPESFSKFTWDKSATLIAEVKEGSPAVAADPRVSVDTNENLGELSIRNILEHDAGDYFCTVEFSDRLPQTTRYTVYIVDSTSKPPSTTTSTRVAQSSTVSTDSGTQSTNDSTSKPPSTTSSTRVAVSSTDSGTQSTDDVLKKFAQKVRLLLFNRIIQRNIFAEKEFVAAPAALSQKILRKKWKK